VRGCPLRCRFSSATRIYDELERDDRLPGKSFSLQDPVPVFAFEPERMSTTELRRLTLGLVDGFTRPGPAIRRFLRAWPGIRSLRIASFSPAESLAGGRTLRANLGFQTRAARPPVERACGASRA